MSDAVPSDLQRELGGLYDGFNARDIDTVLAALAPDVVWPNGWEGGVVRGHEEVRDYWTRQWRQVDPTVTPLGFTYEEDGRVAVQVHQVIRETNGAPIADGQVTHVYRFRDGLVTEMEIRH
jgi:ketosteroid isomerase-like protein